MHISFLISATSTLFTLKTSPDVVDICQYFMIIAHTVVEFSISHTNTSAAYLIFHYIYTLQLRLHVGSQLHTSVLTKKLPHVHIPCWIIACTCSLHHHIQSTTNPSLISVIIPHSMQHNNNLLFEWQIIVSKDGKGCFLCDEDKSTFKSW